MCARVSHIPTALTQSLMTSRPPPQNHTGVGLNRGTRRLFKKFAFECDTAVITD